MGFRHCLLTAGSWSQHLQPHRGGSTVGGGSPRYRTVPLFPFLWTCIVASEPASSSVSSHSLNHLSSWVLAAVPEVSHLTPCFHSRRREWQSPRMVRLALLPEEQASALSAQRRQRKLCPNFFPTQSTTHKNSVNMLEGATLHKHRTAKMGILESPLTPQPKD